jgi:hypothetical protein
MIKVPKTLLLIYCKKSYFTEALVRYSLFWTTDEITDVTKTSNSYDEINNMKYIGVTW